MSEYPQFAYSMNEVRRVGEQLKANVVWQEEAQDEIKELFRIANNWRDAHALPMRRVRSELAGAMVSLRLQGITAARLKRMRSIRKKLRKTRYNLSQIQDLAGCRAILPSMHDVTTLIEAYRTTTRFEVIRTDDYIQSPKQDGYRSFHAVVRFRGCGDEEIFSGRRVEVQIRSRLQHSWATAVEAVGLFNGEDYKGGGGDVRWRRLFTLMSSELAVAESCPELANVPDRLARSVEIRQLDTELNATGVLENLNQAFNYLDNYVAEKSRYFLIEYDNIRSEVRVSGYDSSVVGTASFDRSESRTKMNAVLVEADKLDILKDAYPNYFGDVQLFRRNLKDITRGKGAREYSMPPQPLAPPPPREPADMSWFKRSSRQRKPTR